MKNLVIVCVLVGVLQVTSKSLSGQQKQIVQKFHETCQREFNITEDQLEQTRAGQFPEEFNFKNYLNCFSQMIGFQDSNGLIQKEVFQKKLSSMVDDEDLLSKLVDKCTEQKDTPQDTAFNSAKCLREYAPHLHIFKRILYLSNQQTHQMLQDHKECGSKDPLGEEVLEQARKQGVLFEDPKFKGYIYCFSKKQGFQREDGTIDIESGRKCFNTIVDDSLVADKLVEKCLVEQDTPENTAFFIFKCVDENSPVWVDIFPREVPVPDQEAKKIIDNSRACIKETNVDRELLEKIRQGIYPEDPVLKEFFFCLSKRTGVLNDAGEIQVDVLREKTLRLISNSVVVEKLIEKCAVRKETPQETAFYAHECFFKNSPGHLSVFQFGALSAAQKEKRDSIIKACSSQANVARDVVLRARKGDFQDDPLLKQYLLCVNKKWGVLDESGEFRRDVTKTGLSEIFNAEEAEKLVEKCARTLDNPLETSFESIRCFFNEAPEVANVF